MQLYAILRRNGWRTAGDLEAAAQRSTADGRRDARRHPLDPQLRARGGGRLGRHGLHLPGDEPGGDPAHAAAADLPVDEIIQVADTVIVAARPDPAP